MSRTCRPNICLSSPTREGKVTNTQVQALVSDKLKVNRLNAPASIQETWSEWNLQHDRTERPRAWTSL